MYAGKKAHGRKKASRYAFEQMTPSSGHRLQTEGKAQKAIKNLKEKDEDLLKELKRIKKLQKGLYREYEIGEDTLED